ncbi:MAG: alpha/beta hydrolase family protein [bacterium]
MMKRFSILFSLLLISSQCYAKSDLVPLELFANHSQFTDVKISPTGKYLAFTFESGSEIKLGIIDRKSHKVTASFGFGDNRQVRRFRWLNNDRVGMFVITFTGWLDGKRPDTIFAAGNADGSKRQILWDFQRSNISIVSILPDDPEYILVAKRHYIDAGKTKLQRMNIYKEKMHFVDDAPPKARNTVPGVISFATDLDNHVRFAIERDQGEDELIENDDITRLHYKDKNNTWKSVVLDRQRDNAKVYIAGVSKDQSKGYFISNYDMAESDTTGLFELDMNSGEIRLIYRHDEVDIGGVIKGNDGQLIAVYIEPGYPKIVYVNEVGNESDIALSKGLEAAFKGQFVRIISRTQDGSMAVVKVSSDRNPGEYYIYDQKAKKMSYFASSMPKIKADKMARVEPFILTARDGLKMYGQLTIPNGVEKKNLPLVIYPHGGPYGVGDHWGWSARPQLLANRGYLVLQLNYRGSGGYGDDFEQAGYTVWGTKMQDDLTDATHWAINSGLADPDRICIHGVSYGGYASMQAVVREPDLYKCTIPDAGLYEFKLQWSKADSFIGARSKYKANYMEQAIGGLENNEERSPVYHVDKVKANILIVHGTKDVRVPIENAYLLEKKLKQAGKPYQKIYKKDGHGFQNEKNRVQLYKKILHFLEENIGKGAKPKH